MCGLAAQLIFIVVRNKCKTCDDYEDNENCPYGLFHGPSGSMELNNALVLFGRSEALGFRYLTYVADGDSKILPHLFALDPYPGYIIEKGGMW